MLLDNDSTLKSEYDTNELKFIEDNQLKIGSKVKITRPAALNEQGWNNTWIDGDMDDNIGKIGTIHDFGDSASGIAIIFNDEEVPYSYPYFIIEKA